MELDFHTLSLLKGQFTYGDAESKGIRVITRVGRSKRFIPEFAVNDHQLRSVILHCTVAYAFRGCKIPQDLLINLKNIEMLARDKAARVKAIADGSEKKYWDRMSEYLAAVENTGGWMELVSAVAWRSWRNVPPWRTKEVADSLAIKPSTVINIVSALKRTATFMGYPTYQPRKENPAKEQARKDRQSAVENLWKEGLTVPQICKRLNATPQSVRPHLKRVGLWSWRGNPAKHPYQVRFSLLADGKGEDIVALWSQGLGVYQIAKAIHPNKTVKQLRGYCNVVKRVLKRQGLYPRQVVTAHSNVYGSRTAL